MSELLIFLNWYLWITLVGLVSLPIVWRFFPNLPAKGVAFARPLGLMLWGFAFWLLGSLGILQNDLGGVLTAFVLLIVFSVYCSAKGRFAELKSWLKANLKTLVTMEALFFVAFALWTVVRAANPDVTYTEKPMELAFINAILRSPGFHLWIPGYPVCHFLLLFWLRDCHHVDQNHGRHLFGRFQPVRILVVRPECIGGLRHRI
jgi:hypothetical protein